MKKFQFKPAFTRNDYIIFLRKYKNLLLFRGKSSLSYKFFEKVLIEFKKKYKVAPFISIYKAIYNLAPLFGFLKRKIGYKIKSYPALINSNKRKMLLLK
jgi:ribosomal protein S7